MNKIFGLLKLAQYFAKKLQGKYPGIYRTKGEIDPEAYSPKDMGDQYVPGAWEIGGAIVADQEIVDAMMLAKAEGVGWKAFGKEVNPNTKEPGLGLSDDVLNAAGAGARSPKTFFHWLMQNAKYKVEQEKEEPLEGAPAETEEPKAFSYEDMPGIYEDRPYFWISFGGIDKYKLEIWSETDKNSHYYNNIYVPYVKQTDSSLIYSNQGQDDIDFSNMRLGQFLDTDRILDTGDSKIYIRITFGGKKLDDNKKIDLLNLKIPYAGSFDGVMTFTADETIEVIEFFKDKIGKMANKKESNLIKLANYFMQKLGFIKIAVYPGITRIGYVDIHDYGPSMKARWMPEKPGEWIIEDGGKVIRLSDEDIAAAEKKAGPPLGLKWLAFTDDVDPNTKEKGLGLSKALILAASRDATPTTFFNWLMKNISDKYRDEEDYNRDHGQESVQEEDIDISEYDEITNSNNTTVPVFYILFGSGYRLRFTPGIPLQRQVGAATSGANIDYYNKTYLPYIKKNYPQYIFAHGQPGEEVNFYRMLFADFLNIQSALGAGVRVKIDKYEMDLGNGGIEAESDDLGGMPFVDMFKNKSLLSDAAIIALTVSEAKQLINFFRTKFGARQQKAAKYNQSKLMKVANYFAKKI